MTRQPHHAYRPIADAISNNLSTKDQAAPARHRVGVRQARQATGAADGQTMRLTQYAIQTLKDEWPVQAALTRLLGWPAHGPSARLSGHNQRTHCPLCDPGQHRRSDAFSYGHYWFHCFRCGNKGDVITLIMKAGNLAFKGAVAILEEHASNYLKSRLANPNQRLSITTRLALDDKNRASRMLKLERSMTMDLTRATSRERDRLIREVDRQEALGTIEPFEAAWEREKIEARFMPVFLEIDECFETAERFWLEEINKPMPHKEAPHGKQDQDPHSPIAGNNGTQSQRVDRIANRNSQSQDSHRQG